MLLVHRVSFYTGKLLPNHCKRQCSNFSFSNVEHKQLLELQLLFSQHHVQLHCDGMVEAVVVVALLCLPPPALCGRFFDK